MCIQAAILRIQASPMCIQALSCASSRRPPRPSSSSRFVLVNAPSLTATSFQPPLLLPPPSLAQGRSGDHERVTQLLTGGCSINTADHDGRTCLHEAASYGNRQVVAVLLESGADVNITDRLGRTPLAECIKEGHGLASGLHLLLEAKGQLLWSEEKASSELCDLARRGDLGTMQLLLKGGCDANAAGCDKRTCLHLAASEGNLTVAEALCKHAGIDVNCKDRWNNTPLSDAVGHKHEKVASLLHSHGARMSYEPEIMSRRQHVHIKCQL